jgi:hypothetical protein
MNIPKISALKTFLLNLIFQLIKLGKVSKKINIKNIFISIEDLRNYDKEN